jgi:hypothetical protein
MNLLKGLNEINSYKKTDLSTDYEWQSSSVSDTTVKFNALSQIVTENK